MNDPSEQPGLRIRIIFGPEEMMGPGKAELLERIEKAGSIAAAGREMGMSYKRAWMLVETLNSMFREPLVRSVRGGARGGGAILTDAGKAALVEYRSLESGARAATQGNLARLRSMLRDMPDGK